MTDLKRNLDSHTFVFALGKGKGLGRIENVRWIFRKMIRKLSAPMVDTSVTYAQYEALDQDAKLEKKRAPGSWTPSRYKGNRRAIADLREKTLIVYDLDYVTHEQLDDIRQGFVGIADYAWFMHTTRSHTPESPRVRMVIPTSRPMQPDEAHAVFRLLALTLADDPEEAIEIPDLVSFRGNQTMFWPSISQGQEFWADRNDAPILDVDAFLAENPDWENFENLPYQTEERKNGKIDPNRRMEDPYEKPGEMGAFNRAYTVQEVIQEFLPEVYSPVDTESGEERYTYLQGTASSGAVVYEDGKFLHSNHGSDPVTTCNAFDLCRLHMFGHLDSDAHHNVSPGNMPSFKAMMDFARKDARVIADMYSGFDDTLDDLADDDADEDEDERPAPQPRQDDDDDLLGPEPGGEDDGDLGNKLDDLDDDDEPVERPKKDKPDHTWTANFRRKANGDLEPVLNNATLIVSNDRRAKDSIGYNEFTLDPVCFKPIRAPKIETPSKNVAKRDRKTGRGWEDADDMSIQIILSANAERGGYEVDIARTHIETAVLNQGMNNPIHPVKDFLEACEAKWRSKNAPTGNIERLAIDYLGCPDTPFHRESSRMLLIAAVARIYEPGCKFDVMPIIEGPTGSRKSTFWDILFGGFTTELKCDLDKTDRVIENLRGNWAVEMAEMAAAKKADSNTLKMQLSSSRDVHRLAYAKREKEFPRQSIWVGTSNEDDYLTDPTSTRRYWVWRTLLSRFNPIDTAKLERNLWALWGEAMYAYKTMRQEKAHGDLWLDLQDHDVILEANQIAEGSRKRTAAENVSEIVRDWLDTPVPAEDALVDKDGMTLAGYEGDVTPMVRNMVTPKEAFEALRDEPVVQAYRNSSTAVFGKALKLVPGWSEVGKVRRHGSNQTVWFVRDEDGPLWVPAENHEDHEVDDLLG
ncbi:VapE domain-containing protein [Shimia sp.]|uniref:VapE domain-containing protein n=1 Tax=Shimia sp. TaxID=1954381 RepID=UPI0032997DEA